MVPVPNAHTEMITPLLPLVARSLLWVLHSLEMEFATDPLELHFKEIAKGRGLPPLNPMECENFRCLLLEGHSHQACAGGDVLG